MKLRGKEWPELSQRCKQWGICYATEKSYLDSVEAKLRKMVRH